MALWEIHGRELVNCNCAYGCPCQFNALPTFGTCEAASIFEIDKGHHGDVKLDGLRVGVTYKWPGAVHEGNGEMQIIIDERASPAQREALEKIMTGQDTSEMATMWYIFSAMCPTKHETLFKPITSSMDLEARRGQGSVMEVFDIDVEPIKNPVTGAEHRARIDLPLGFEYAIAEIASGTTRTQGVVDLPNQNGTHAHLAELHISSEGVIRSAA